jgi:hypothetical protein
MSQAKGGDVEAGAAEDHDGKVEDEKENIDVEDKVDELAMSPMSPTDVGHDDINEIEKSGV